MNNNNDRKGRTKDVKGVFFPTPAAQFEMPDWYGEMLVSIKELVANGRRQVMFTANVQMSMMYYRIGQIILQRQNNEGWGSKVVDRLSADLKIAFPEMHGFSPRNLKYMRRFCEIWPDEEIVQRTVAQLPWRHNICLMEKVKEPNRRLAYAMAAIKYGWSRTILELQLENYTIERTGKLPTNWRTQKAMGTLFDCTVDNIWLHLKNIYESGELEKEGTFEEFSVVRMS